MVRGSRSYNELVFVSAEKGLTAIKEQLAVTPAAPDPSPKSLPLSSLHLCEAVFQQRDKATGSYNMEAHIRVLMGALSHSKDLDPVTVWWGGFGWLVVYGHHRVQAYDRKGHTGPIPVVVFEGSPEDALLESARLNARDKLVMSAQEKANAAARFCLLTSKSKREIMRASGASEGTVATIRRVIASLREKGVTDSVMVTKTWRELKELNRGEPPPDFPDIDTYTQKVADEIRGRLLDVLGDNVIHGGPALALALSQLPQELALGAMRSIYWPVPWGEPEEDEEMDY